MRADGEKRGGGRGRKERQNKDSTGKPAKKARKGGDIKKGPCLEDLFGGDAGDLSDDLWGEGYGAKGLAADLLDFEDYDPYIKSLNVDMEREVTKR